MDVSRQSLAMRGMVGLLGALRSSKNAHDQIINRGQKPIKQLLLEILEVTDQERRPLLL